MLCRESEYHGAFLIFIPSRPPPQRIVLLSVLGPVGAVLEVVLILYLIAASLLGCYSLPVVARIRPRRGDTPMVHVIANCAIVLILSSALPLLARTLGKCVLVGQGEELVCVAGALGKWTEEKVRVEEEGQDLRVEKEYV